MKMLRRALEDANASNATDAEPTIELKGPLSENFRQALDVAYAKADPNADEPAPEAVAAMESQQMDVAVLQKLAASLAANQETPTEQIQTVYGVSRNDLDNDVVVEVTQEVVNQPDNSEFVLVIDGVNPGANGDQAAAPEETVMQLSSALECIVNAHGGKVFTSFKAYAASRVK